MGQWHLVGHWRLPDRYKLLHLLHEDKTAIPSKFRRKLIPKIWYFLVNAGAVHFLPFLGIYWRSLGFSTQQIGILQALRPWISAASGNVLTPLADHFNIHFAMLLATYALTMISRGLMTISFPFGIMLALSLLMESAVSPMSILVDATVVAGSVKDGTYGRARLWASVGWGCFAPVAGAILTKYGIHVCFMVFVGIYTSAFIPTLLIPAGLLQDASRKFRTSSGSDKSSNSNLSASDQQNEAVGAFTTDVPPENVKEKVVQSDPVNVTPAATVDAAVDVAIVSTAIRSPSSAGVSRRSTRGHGESPQTAAQVPIDVVVVPPARQKTTDGSPESASQQSLPVLSLTSDTRSGHSTLPEIIILPTDSNCEKEKVETTVSEEQLKAFAAANNQGQEVSLWQGLKPLLADVRVLAFFFKALLMGIGNGCIGYLFLVISDLGASGTLLGLCLTMNCIGEVPVFYFSGSLIKRLGINVSINLGMAAYLLRLVCYAVLPQYPTLWLVLPVELLQGATFALAYSAGTVHCRRIAPKRLRSTIQSIFSGLYTGVGAGIGGLAGGLLIGAFNGKVMFFSAAVALLVGWIIADAAYLIDTVRRSVQGGASTVRSLSKALGPGLGL